MNLSSATASIAARLSRNSEERVPCMLDGTSLLEAGFSDCANEEVRVNPDGILLLHPAIGGMDMHVFACYIAMRRWGENRELRTFSIVIVQDKTVTRSMTLTTKNWATSDIRKTYSFLKLSSKRQICNAITYHLPNREESCTIFHCEIFGIAYWLLISDFPPYFGQLTSFLQYLLSRWQRKF